MTDACKRYFELLKERDEERKKEKERLIKRREWELRSYVCDVYEKRQRRQHVR